MASLDKRLKAMGVVCIPVVAPRIQIMFVSPTRGIVSMRFWDGRGLERGTDETEVQFLARAAYLEAPHAQA